MADDLKEYAEARNVSMYPDQWHTVEALAQRLALGISAALRIIVQEYDENTNRIYDTYTAVERD